MFMENETTTPDEGASFDLEDFSSDLFGNDAASDNQEADENNASEEVTEEEAPDGEEDSEDTETTETETEEDEDNLDGEEASDDEDPEDEDDEASEPNDKDEPKGKPKKANRYQERVNQLVAEREAERREKEELLKRLDAIEKTTKDNAAKEPESNVDAPSPEARNEDGTPKYPLGKYDPDYIGDLAEFKTEAAQKRIDRQREQERQQREAAIQRETLEAEWDTKLEPAKVKYPDFDVKGEQLMSVVQNYDQDYAAYLANTIMSMDHGPDVLYYLGENLDETVKILQQGPQKATLSLGRLEAKFAEATQEKAKAKPKASQAPKPPARINKGITQSMPSVPGDTDDLSAYENQFFRKKN